MAKILIVEDEGILAYHLQTIVEQMGHSVVGIADNAAAGIGPFIAIIGNHEKKTDIGEGKK